MKNLSAVVVLVMCIVAVASLKQPLAIKKFAKGKPPGKHAMAPSSQHNFNIVIKNTELKLKPNDFISDETKVETTMFNDTMSTISGKIYMKQDFPQNLQIQVTGYKFSNTNQWMQSFDQGKQLYCKYKEENISFMKNVLIASDFDECPIKKGVYTITHMVVDEKGFPPGLPPSQFRIDASFIVDNKEIARFSAYADVEPKDDDDS